MSIPCQDHVKGYEIIAEKLEVRAKSTKAFFLNLVKSSANALSTILISHC